MENVEQYSGVWTLRDENGKAVKTKGISFDRVFRGYRFSDDECQALLQGYYVDVNNIEYCGVKYSVRGRLEETISQIETITYSYVRFTPVYTLTNRSVRDEKVESAFDVNNENLGDEARLEAAMLEMEDEDAEFMAMLDAPECPKVVKVSRRNEPAKYVPVIPKFNM